MVESQNCTIFSIPKDRLDEALDIYPDYLNFYKQRALRRYHYLKSVRDEIREEVFQTFDIETEAYFTQIGQQSDGRSHYSSKKSVISRLYMEGGQEEEKQSPETQRNRPAANIGV